MKYLSTARHVRFPKFEFGTSNTIVVFDLIGLTYKCMFIMVFDWNTFTNTSMYSINHIGQILYITIMTI